MSAQAKKTVNILRRFQKRFRNWIFRRYFLLLYARCHECAEGICRIGFDFPEDIQADLSAAKDHLYSAASEFKKRADDKSKGAL